MAKQKNVNPCTRCGKDMPPHSSYRTCWDCRHPVKTDLIDQAYERQVENELLESARTHVITPDEHAAQVVSFVYGNLAIDDQTITRDEVKRQQEKELSDHE